MFENFLHMLQAAPTETDVPATPPPFELTAEGLTQTADYYGHAIVNNAIGFAPKLIAAGLVLWIGSWFAGKVHSAVLKRVNSIERIDTTLGTFAATFARYVIVAGVVLLAVSILGVKVASIFVVLSAMTLAIGLALQGSMSNVAAGLLMIILRPYKIGDYVELMGVEGIVDDLNIFQTTLRTLDNVKVIMSNNDVRSDVIRNFSSLGVRRIDIDFGIDYDDEMSKAIEIIKDTAAKHPNVLSEPEGPWAKVSLLNDSSVDIQLRVWANSHDYWETRFDLIRSVKEAFDTGGISIPYPHLVEVEK